MNSGRTVFSQLMDFLPKNEFDKCVQRYHGSYRIRKFSCYDQYLCLAIANEKRDWRIYADFAVAIKQTAYAFDSTTIDLCLPFPGSKEIKGRLSSSLTFREIFLIS